MVPVASAICDASVRCQTNRYSAISWLLSSPSTCLGLRNGVVGRIASWASWAFFTFDAYCFGVGDRYCWPYSLVIVSRTSVDGFAGQRDVVGSHVRDEPPLVQTLRESHHLRRRQTQPAPALLLQGRGHERRLGRRPERPLLDAAHRERRVGEAVGERPGARLVEGDDLGVGGVAQHAAGVEVLPGGDLRVVDGDEGGGERRRGRRDELDVPVAGGDERDALTLALDDEPDRRALDPSRRQPPVDPPPQHRGHLVAVETVEDAAGLGGVDEPVVDPAGVVDGVVDGGLGDLVEHHPLHRHLRLQVLEQVPADRLTLAVLVGGEVELAGVLQAPA